MSALSVSGALILAAAFAASATLAQQPNSARPIARLTGVQGNVLVSQADAMAAAVNEQKLTPGVRVITTAGAKVTIAYDGGCLVNLGENRRYTVREEAECMAAKAPPLGRAESFAVLGGARVVNAGSSVIRGDLGVSPGTLVSGFPQGRVVDGTIETAGAISTQAQRDAATAYADLEAQRCNLRLTGQDLGGQTLTPGVYCFPGGPAKLTGELVLDAQGDPDAVFVFQVGATLTTANQSVVRVINGGQENAEGSQASDERDRRRATLCNVYWMVGDSVALGRDSVFIGTIIALSGISVQNQASVYGRTLARTGPVTLDRSAVELPRCFVPVAYLPAGVLGAIGAAIGAGAIVESTKKPNSPN